MALGIEYRCADTDGEKRAFTAVEREACIADALDLSQELFRTGDRVLCQNFKVTATDKVLRDVCRGEGEDGLSQSTGVSRNGSTATLLQTQGKFTGDNLKIGHLIEVAYAQIYGFSVLVTQLQHHGHGKAAQNFAGRILACELSEIRADAVVPVCITQNVVHL